MEDNKLRALFFKKENKLKKIQKFHLNENCNHHLQSKYHLEKVRKFDYDVLYNYFKFLGSI